MRAVTPWRNPCRGVDPDHYVLAAHIENDNWTYTIAPRSETVLSKGELVVAESPYEDDSIFDFLLKHLRKRWVTPKYPLWFGARNVVELSSMPPDTLRDSTSLWTTALTFEEASAFGELYNMGGNYPVEWGVREDTLRLMAVVCGCVNGLRRVESWEALADLVVGWDGVPFDDIASFDIGRDLDSENFTKRVERLKRLRDSASAIGELKLAGTLFHHDLEGDEFFNAVVHAREAIQIFSDGQGGVVHGLVDAAYGGVTLLVVHELLKREQTAYCS